jgi:Ca2+/Na+ antiporter
MLVTLAASAASTVIPNLANTLQSWLTRNERHKISLEIGGNKLEVTGVSVLAKNSLIILFTILLAWQSN